MILGKLASSFASAALTTLRTARYCEHLRRTTATEKVLGATGGSFSLIEHSRDETSVAARTLVTQQPPSTLLSAQEKSQSIIQSEPVQASFVGLAYCPTYLAHVQKKANRKHQAGPHYASLGHLFSSLRDGWYRAVGPSRPAQRTLHTC